MKLTGIETEEEEDNQEKENVLLSSAGRRSNNESIIISYMVDIIRSSDLLMALITKTTLFSDTSVSQSRPVLSQDK